MYDISGPPNTMTLPHAPSEPYAPSDTVQPSPPLSDSTLLARAREGDGEAFRRLVERYEATVLAVSTGMLGQRPEVMDVAQDTFIHFYESLHRFREEAGLKTYLTRIAINRSLDALRRHNRWRKRLVPSDDLEAMAAPACDASAETIQTQQAAFVDQAIQQLPPKYRAVVVLRLVEGYSTEETAALLNLRYGTVLSRLSRARDRLRDYLAPYIQETPDASP